MNVLEKILEEIEKRLNMVKNIPVNEEDDFLDGEECYENGRVQGRYEELVVCQEIIRSYMNDIPDTNVGGDNDTEEKIRVHIAECLHRIDNIRSFVGSKEYINNDEKCIRNIEVLKTIIVALEEYLSLKKKNDNDGWIPVEDTEHTPKDESYVLVSFSNFSLPDIARYEENEEGGTYYPGDDEDSYLKYGLFVNAWMPIPKPYRHEDI